MASDILLVLASEHRHLDLLASRCLRAGRGFEDPEGDLRRALLAHLSAMQADLHALVKRTPGAAQFDPTLLSPAKEQVAGASTPTELASLVHRVVDFEQGLVLPVLESTNLADRRRMGKVYKLRRDQVLAADAAAHRRRRSQSELYELARRAGVGQRSRMTQAQLDAAVVHHELRASGSSS